MTLRDDLIRVALRFGEAKTLLPAQVSRIIFTDGKTLPRVLDGGDVTTGSWERAMSALSDRWPADLAWPSDIPRPATSQSGIAAGLAPYAAARHQIELEMQRAVRKLPVAGWAKAVRGLGELGLAVIIGEAGDLSKYSNPGKLWKRLGLAPHEGKAYSTWRREGGLSAEDWTAAGYAPRRRAEIYACIGDPLFRAQAAAADKETGEITREAGPYRQAYDQRRLRTAETHPDWTKLHSHNDALRIMTKVLIADLWSAWRRATPDMKPIVVAPAADTMPAEPEDRRGLTESDIHCPVAPAAMAAVRRIAEAVRP